MVRQSADRSSESLLLRVALLAGVALACGLGVSRWLEQRQATVWTGRLHAHECIVRAPHSGRLKELAATTGQIVDSKARLARIEDDAVEHRRELARQRVAALEMELAQAQAKAEINLSWRLRTIESERYETRLKQATFLQQKLDNDLRLQSIDEQFEDQPKGSASSVTPALFDVPKERTDSSLELRLKREAAINGAEVAAAQVALCDRRLAQLDKLAERLTERVNRADGVEAAEARLARARADLERMDAEPTTAEVVAPAFGTVGRWQKRVGDPVAAGEPLVTLFDEDRRHVLVCVPSSQIGLFTETTDVSLIFPGRVKRKGIVAPLPRQTDRPLAESEFAPRDAGPYVVVRIDATDRLWPEAPIGSAVEVRVAR